jgi:hypothetical protein
MSIDSGTFARPPAQKGQKERTTQKEPFKKSGNSKNSLDLGWGFGIIMLAYANSNIKPQMNDSTL